jgi:hypothetical protein
MQQVFFWIDLCQYHSKRLHTHFLGGGGYYSFQKNKGSKTGNHQTNKGTLEELESIWEKSCFFRAQIPCHGPHGWLLTSNRGFQLSSPYYFHVGFVVNKVVLTGFFSAYIGFLLSSSFLQCSIPISVFMTARNRKRSLQTLQECDAFSEIWEQHEINYFQIDACYRIKEVQLFSQASYRGHIIAISRKIYFEIPNFILCFLAAVTGILIRVYQWLPYKHSYQGSNVTSGRSYFKTSSNADSSACTVTD